MARTHDTDDVRAIEVTLAHGVDHGRGIGGLDEAAGIIVIGEIGGGDVVLAYKFLFLQRPFKDITPVVVPVNLATSTGEVPQVFLGHCKKLLLAAHDIEQFTGQIHAHPLQTGKGDAIGQRGVKTIAAHD